MTTEEAIEALRKAAVDLPKDYCIKIDVSSDGVYAEAFDDGGGDVGIYSTPDAVQRAIEAACEHDRNKRESEAMRL